jgi:excisionase family DNA binding protein
MKTANPESALEPMIGANEAAKLLGWSAVTIRRRAQRGTLPSYAFPRGNGKVLHRFRLSDLKAYLLALKQAPTP